VVALLQDIHASFEDSLSKYPPANEGALAPVSYAGFRWATQLDPVCNLYFLSLVLSIAENVEGARLPPEINRIFSYRYKWNEATADLFDSRYHWGVFMECSLRHAKSHKFVVVCDISEFYPRLGHHRLENALLHLSVQSDAHKRIMTFERCAQTHYDVSQQLLEYQLIWPSCGGDRRPEFCPN
jgi:hypothetical protein